jgi:hypothetical protein
MLDHSKWARLGHAIVYYQQLKTICIHKRKKEKHRDIEYNTKQYFGGPEC